MLCDLPHHTTHTLRSFWKLKCVLLYMLAASSLTAADAVLRLAVHVSVDWNPQFYVDATNTSIGAAAPYLVAMEGERRDCLARIMGSL